MFRFIIGVLLLLTAIVVPVISADELRKGVRTAIGSLLGLFGIIFLVFSTSLKVDSNEGGLITKMFGAGLEDGRIIAVNGERGVQADVLSPGWSFGWWPWQYRLESVKNIEISSGKVGVVVAMDGAPMPAGEVYAQEWKSPTDMLDARKFLTGNGVKGPQLTVLPPGQYRYNPKLFSISEADITDVKIGYGAIVRANAGITAASNEVEIVDGTRLVPRNCKGHWNEALPPGQYYMHPGAYDIIMAKTSQRMYSYTSESGSEANTSTGKEPDGDNSVQVRTKDGYKIPCDIRTGISVSLKDLPYLIARIPDPDEDDNKNGFDNLEERVILPAIRAILRNTSENQEALSYVASRSVVEAEAGAAFTAVMKANRLTVDSFYLADINIDSTPEGQALLKTQTDAKLAAEQQKMYEAQVASETKRGEQVKAMATADMQKQIQESLAQIAVASNAMTAAEYKAKGDAAQSLVYEAKVKAMGGTDAMTKLELSKLMIEMLPQAANALKGIVLPEVLVVGGTGESKGSVDPTTALMAVLTKSMTAVEATSDMQIKDAKAAPAKK